MELGRYQVFDQLKKAEASGTAFKQSVLLLEKVKEPVKKIKERCGGYSVGWLIFSPIGMAIFFSLVIFAALSVEDTVKVAAGNLLPDWGYTVFGAGLSLIGVVLGHTLKKLSERDSDFGKFKRGFWFSLVGCILYVVLQYSSAKVAVGTVGDTGLRFMPILIAGFCLLEITLGFLILEKVVNHFLLLIFGFFQFFILRRVGILAARASSFYQECQKLRNMYNERNIAQIGQLSISNSLMRAIRYSEAIDTSSGSDTWEPQDEPTAQISEVPNNGQFLEDEGITPLGDFFGATKDDVEL